MEVVKFKFDFFDRIKDRVSGYQGVVLGMSFYSTGCRHYGIASEKLNKDKKIGEYEWLDESRLILLKKAIAEKPKKKTGGKKEKGK